MTISTNNNAGISITNPSYNLQLANTLTTNLGGAILTQFGTPSITLSSVSNNGATFAGPSGGVYTLSIYAGSVSTWGNTVLLTGITLVTGGTYLFSVQISGTASTFTISDGTSTLLTGPVTGSYVTYTATVTNYNNSSNQFYISGYGTSPQTVLLKNFTIQSLNTTLTGSVGIGTLNPSANLQVVGSLAKSSGTFDIVHPLYPGTARRLVHSFVEAPRCDLMYRGTVVLISGTATIDVNQKCTANPIGAMDDGTFEALCTNSQFFLQNMTGFDRVVGSLSGSSLVITCENSESTDKVSWLIVAERADSFIKGWERTDENGLLITQYTSASAIESDINPQ